MVDDARLNAIADIDEAHWWLETRQLTRRKQKATEFVCDCGHKQVIAGYPVASAVEGRAMRLHVARMIVDAGHGGPSVPHFQDIDTVEQLSALPKWSVIVLAESGVAFQKYWEGQWRGTNGANIAADDPDLDELLPATLVSPGRPALFTVAVDSAL